MKLRKEQNIQQLNQSSNILDEAKKGDKLYLDLGYIVGYYVVSSPAQSSKSTSIEKAKKKQSPKKN